MSIGSYVCGSSTARRAVTSARAFHRLDRVGPAAGRPQHVTELPQRLGVFGLVEARVEIGQPAADLGAFSQQCQVRLEQREGIREFRPVRGQVHGGQVAVAVEQNAVDDL
jgi:hypothetical protein